MISRATNGNDTKIVASTMPGTAKTILMSCSASHGPRNPCRPNSRTNTMPEITGDTANGRSISVVSSCLPRKVELARSPSRADAEHQVRRHGDRRGEQRQRQRRQRVGLAGSPSGRRPSPCRKRLGEHGDERQHEKQQQEPERDGRQQPSGPAAARSAAARLRIARRVPRLHVPPSAAPACRLLQPCSALMVSSSVNDISSITSAIAVAPA